MARRVHKDCPFTADEIEEFNAMLYSVNTSFHCINSAPVSWSKATRIIAANIDNNSDYDKQAILHP